MVGHMPQLVHLGAGSAPQGPVQSRQQRGGMEAGKIFWEAAGKKVYSSRDS